jgi:DNA-binding NtrC family response regulator
MPEPERPQIRDLQPDKVVTVLAVTDVPDDVENLSEIFSRSNWVIYSVKACEQAVRFLKSHRVPVVLCERNLADGLWTDLLPQFENLTEPPVLIVTSPHADESLWAEVLNLGGYDVLPQPFERAEVVRVVSLAWMHWRNRNARMVRATESQPRVPLAATA